MTHSTPIITVDKLNLVCKLPQSSLQDIIHTMSWRPGTDKDHFHKIYRHKRTDPYYQIYLYPKNTYVRSHYNIMICMSNKTFQHGTPEPLQYLFSIGDWKIKHIDIAYDFIEPMDKSFYLKPKNAQTIPYTSTSNEYICAKSNKAGALLYDKKTQAKEILKIQLPYSHLTRFEIRLTPTLAHQPVFDPTMDFNWLKPSFDKFTFIPNIDDVALNKEQRTQVSAYAKDKKWKSDFPRRQKEKLLQLLKTNSVDFYHLFNSNKLNLFEFSEEKAS